ncbi:MAG: DUF58 domain-containing protein [Thermofilaceae archaeon]
MNGKLCEEVRKAALIGRARAESFLIGEYPVNLKGIGLEYTDLREYHPGDDYRRIDWRVSARIGLGLGKLFVKEYRTEKMVRLAYLLDLTASMSFKKKIKTLAFTVAFHARLSEALRDEVAVLTISDKVRVRSFSRPTAALVDILETACKGNIQGALDLSDAMPEILNLARGIPVAVYTDYANTADSYSRIAKAILASGGNLKFYVFVTASEREPASWKWELPLTESELSSLSLQSIEDFSREVKKHIALVKSLTPYRSIIEVPVTSIDPPLIPLLTSYLALRSSA